MKDNGLAAWNMDLECGEGLKEILISDSGNSEKLMVMEFMFGQMEIVTKDSLNNVWKMAKGYKNLPMVTYIKDFMQTANQMAMGNITGQMEVILKGFLKMVYVVDRDYGRRVLVTVINMKDNI